jgi:hypothetical protein
MVCRYGFVCLPVAGYEMLTGRRVFEAGSQATMI